MRKPSKTIMQIEEEIGKPEEFVVKPREDREIEIIRSPSGLFAAKWIGGGEIPDMLKGHFTSKNVAQAQVDKYFSEIELKKKSEPSMFGMEHLRG